MARLPGVSSAAPMPCTALAAIRTGASGAMPHSSDATANHTTPMQEDPLAAVLVAQRAGEQQQPGQRQRVGGDHPLQGGQAGVKVAADGGQRDADHRRVDRGHRDPSTVASSTHRPGPLAYLRPGTAGSDLQAAHVSPPPGGTLRDGARRENHLPGPRRPLLASSEARSPRRSGTGPRGSPPILGNLPLYMPADAA